MTITKLITTSAILFSATLTVRTAHAQDDCTASRLMVVLDKSSSMNGMLGDTAKWDTAVDALNQVATAYDQSIQLGLDVFPAAGQCSPGAVMVDPNFGSQAAIAAALDEPPPAAGNWTPMAQTLDAVADHPSLNDPGVPSYVVLITDGWQWCDPYDPGTRFAPADAVNRLAAKGITTFVVGFGDGVDVETLNLMATNAGTDRANCDATSIDPTRDDNCYYQADSPSELVAALMDVAQQIDGVEICDGIDNDCDGEIDEALVQNCSNSCGTGTSVCTAGAWDECDAPTPEAEICDGMDNDCDGSADEVDDEDVDGLCGPDAYCDGECVDMPGEASAAGCGCQSSTRDGLGGLIPLLIGVAFLARRRRRKNKI